MKVNDSNIKFVTNSFIPLLEKLKKHTDGRRGDYQALLAIIREIPPDMLEWFTGFCIIRNKPFWIPIILRAHGSIAKQYFNKEFKLLGYPHMQTQFIHDFLFLHQPKNHKHILDCIQGCLGVSLIKHMRTEVPYLHDNDYRIKKSTTLFEEYASVRKWVSHILSQVVNPRIAPLTSLLILTMKCNISQDKTILTALSTSPKTTKKLIQLYKFAEIQAWNNFALVFTNSGKRLPTSIGKIIAQCLTVTDLLAAYTLASNAKRETDKCLWNNFVLTFINSDTPLYHVVGIIIAQYLSYSDLLSIASSDRPTIQKRSASRDCKATDRIPEARFFSSHQPSTLCAGSGRYHMRPMTSLTGQ